MKISLINHGCAKNLVDAELLLGILSQNGYEITLDEKDADIVIVNTCSFIHDAEKESVQSILQMIEEGKNGYLTSVDDIALMAKYLHDIKKTSRSFDMGQNAIATAKKYTFSTLANAHISAFGRFKNIK